MQHPDSASLRQTLFPRGRSALRLALALGVTALAAPPSPLAAQPGLRLYALDCGRALFTDLGPFSDTGEYDGTPGRLMASCFLIRHPKGDLLWDAGLGDQYANGGSGTPLPNFRALVPRTLGDQLGQLGLTFSDIELFAFSHGHADHLGNAPRLDAATWLVNQDEYDWLMRTPNPPRTNPTLLAAVKEPGRARFHTGDVDVFGDGSVRILATGGHTPGHQVLALRLPRSGNVIVSGDLFHTRENRRGKRMPVFNVSRAETLASIDRIEKIIARTRARLVIQHSEADFASLPQVPAFLD